MSFAPANGASSISHASGVAKANYIMWFFLVYHLDFGLSVTVFSTTAQKRPMLGK